MYSCSNSDEGGDFCLWVEGIAAMQSLVGDLDDEVDVHLLWVELLHQVVGRFHRATRCQQVVVQEDNIVFFDSVLVNLNGVCTIFL